MVWKVESTKVIYNHNVRNWVVRNLFSFNSAIGSARIILFFPFSVVSEDIVNYYTMLQNMAIQYNSLRRELSQQEGTCGHAQGIMHPR